MVIEHGLGIENARDDPGLDCRGFLVQADYDSRHPLLPKWHQDAPAHDRPHTLRHAIGERHIERNWERNIAEFCHFSSLARLNLATTTISSFKSCSPGVLNAQDFSQFRDISLTTILRCDLTIPTIRRPTESVNGYVGHRALTRFYNLG